MNRSSLCAVSLACLTACGAGTSLESPAGAGGSGPVDAGACVTATVTFQVNPAPNTTRSWCLGQPGSCSPDWLEVSNASGSLALSNYCSTPCDSCAMVGCPAICRLPSELTGQGATQAWNGTYYVSDRCGASATACLSPRCASPGQYTARICGFPNPTPDAGFGCGSATSSTQPTCVVQAFQYPSTAPIVVTMPP